MSLSVSFESDEHEKAWFIRVTINARKDLLKSFFRSHTVSLDEIIEQPSEMPEDYRDVWEAVQPDTGRGNVKGSHERISCRADAGIYQSEGGKAKVSLLRCGMRMFSGYAVWRTPALLHSHSSRINA